MKKLIQALALVLVAMFALAALTGCGNGNDANDNDDYVPQTTAAEDVYNGPEDGNDENDENDAPEAAEASLVGTWNYMGSAFYVFEADGSGTMLGTGDIFWSADNGVLLVCSTPPLCGNMAACSGPMEWDYTITGDSLTITSRQIPGMTYTYTRG